MQDTQNIILTYIQIDNNISDYIYLSINMIIFLSYVICGLRKIDDIQSKRILNANKMHNFNR